MLGAAAALTERHLAMTSHVVEGAAAGSRRIAEPSLGSIKNEGAERERVTRTASSHRSKWRKPERADDSPHSRRAAQSLLDQGPFGLQTEPRDPVHEINPIDAFALNIQHANDIPKMLFRAALTEILQLLDDQVFRSAEGGFEVGPAGTRTPRASRVRSNSESVATITSTFCPDAGCKILN